MGIPGASRPARCKKRNQHEQSREFDVDESKSEMNARNCGSIDVYTFGQPRTGASGGILGVAETEHFGQV